MIPNFRLFRSIAYPFQDKNFFRKIAKLPILANFSKFFKLIKFYIITLVIQNNGPFRTIFYLFRDISKQNCQFGGFLKILKSNTIFKVGCSYILWSLWSQILVCYHLSLTVSGKISIYFCFYYFLKINERKYFSFLGRIIEIDISAKKAKIFSLVKMDLTGWCKILNVSNKV